MACFSSLHLSFILVQEEQAKSAALKETCESQISSLQEEVRLVFLLGNTVMKHGHIVRAVSFVVLEIPQMKQALGP